MRSVIALAVLGLASLAAGKDGRSRDGYDDDDNDATGSTQTSGNATTDPASNSTSGLTGGTVCLSYMCVSGVVNGSTTQYTMQSLGKADLGWMAMGFGNQMTGSPMVIMWPNSDGSITISQRQAPGEVMPTVVSNPPRVATANAALSDLTGSQPKLSFTIPTDSSIGQDIIWAFGTDKPDSSESAVLQQHIDSGPTTLDLTQPISSGDTSNPATDPNAVSGGSVSTPLLPFQKMVVAHALLCTIGFLILLPAGALLARYARTFTGVWFKGHWLFQSLFAGPVIVAGVALGIAAVSSQKAMHLDDEHKKWGIALFVLYIVQCSLGAIIHWIKPSSFTVHKKRPIQNYGHAILGLLIIALSFYQVHTGYNVEWLKVRSMPLSNAVNIVFYIWVALIPVLYLAGLAFLPKQFRQERPTTKEATTNTRYSDEPRYSDRA